MREGRDNILFRYKLVYEYLPFFYIENKCKNDLLYASQMYNMFRVYLHFGKVESLFIPVQRPIPWYQGTLFFPKAYTLSCHCVLGRSA